MRFKRDVVKDIGATLKISLPSLLVFPKDELGQNDRIVTPSPAQAYLVFAIWTHRFGSCNLQIIVESQLGSWGHALT